MIFFAFFLFVTAAADIRWFIKFCTVWRFICRTDGGTEDIRAGLASSHYASIAESILTDFITQAGSSLGTVITIEGMV